MQPVLTVEVQIRHFSSLNFLSSLSVQGLPGCPCWLMQLQYPNMPLVGRKNTWEAGKLGRGNEVSQKSLPKQHTEAELILSPIHKGGFGGRECWSR